MGTKNNNKLFFTCSLIEYIGRGMKRTRKEITDELGKEAIERIYEYADVFHCEPIETVAVEFIEEYGITQGDLIMKRSADIEFLIIGSWGRCMNV